KGADSASFSVCVIDTLLNGSATVRTKDIAGNLDTLSFTYCTIPDTKPPAIKADTIGSWLRLRVTDNASWDRGLRTVAVRNVSNTSFSPPVTAFSLASPSFNFNASPVDVTQPSHFEVEAIDTAGN